MRFLHSKINTKLEIVPEELKYSGLPFGITVIGSLKNAHVCTAAMLTKLH